MAHCVVGAARTFATDQAALSLRHHLVEDFGAGELEPDAIHKWTNGDSLWVWETAQAEHQGHGHHKEHGRLGRALSEL